MALTTSEARLFGLDLTAVWEELKRPWRDLDRWPVVRWLTPQLPVRLQHAQGAYSLWRGDRMLRKAADLPATAAKFTAIELPDDLVLRRSLSMPPLSDAEVATAVDLELRSVSPFASDDVVWGYQSRRATPQRLHVEAVVASRKQITAHLAAAGATAPAAAPEVWVLSDAGKPIVLQGFGEQRRQRQAAVWRRVGVALLALAALLLTAIAATPTAQLRMRALEAAESFETVRARTAKLTQEREALIQTTDRLKVLAELIGAQTRPLPALEQITRMLPDNTVLQSLKIEGPKVVINGQTTDAATLMQQLSTLPGVHGVRAPTAAMRPPGAVRETFHIEFTLDEPGAAAAEPAASAPTSGASAPAPAPAASAPMAAASMATPAASRPASATAASKPLP